MHSTANNKIKRGTTLPKTMVIARSTMLETRDECQRRRGSDVVSPMEQVYNITVRGATSCLAWGDQQHTRITR